MPVKEHHHNLNSMTSTSLVYEKPIKTSLQRLILDQRDTDLHNTEDIRNIKHFNMKFTWVFLGNCFFYKHKILNEGSLNSSLMCSLLPHMVFTSRWNLLLCHGWYVKTTPTPSTVWCGWKLQKNILNKPWVIFSIYLFIYFWSYLSFFAYIYIGRT